MTPWQFKTQLKMRVNENLDEYVKTMEEMFDENYWKGFTSVGQGIRAFADHLVEKYEASRIIEEEEDKKEEPPDDELQDVEEGNKKWEVEFTYKGAEPTPHYYSVEGPTKQHAKVLFNRAFSGKDVLISRIIPVFKEK